MNLSEFGYCEYFEQKKNEQNLSEFESARVIIENKERYVVVSKSGELECQVTGKLRFTASSKIDFPAVGDWVAITEIAEGQAIINEIIERKSFIARKAVNSDDLQIIASNIDTAFITTSVDNDFILNRIDRYLAITHTGNIQPAVLLTKIDLITDNQLVEIIEKLKIRHKNIPIYVLSTIENDKFDQFTSILKMEKPIVF